MIAVSQQKAKVDGAPVISGEATGKLFDTGIKEMKRFVGRVSSTFGKLLNVATGFFAATCLFAAVFWVHAPPLLWHTSATLIDLIA